MIIPFLCFIIPVFSLTFTNPCNKLRTEAEQNFAGDILKLLIELGIYKIDLQFSVGPQ